MHAHVHALQTAHPQSRSKVPACKAKCISASRTQKIPILIYSPHLSGASHLRARLKKTHPHILSWLLALTVRLASGLSGPKTRFGKCRENYSPYRPVVAGPIARANRSLFVGIRYFSIAAAGEAVEMNCNDTRGCEVQIDTESGKRPAPSLARGTRGG